MLYVEYVSFICTSIPTVRSLLSLKKLRQRRGETIEKEEKMSVDLLQGFLEKEPFACRDYLAIYTPKTAVHDILKLHIFQEDSHDGRRTF